MNATARHCLPHSLKALLPHLLHRQELKGGCLKDVISTLGNIGLRPDTRHRYTKIQGNDFKYTKIQNNDFNYKATSTRSHRGQKTLRAPQNIERKQNDKWKAHREHEITVTRLTHF